MANDQRAPTEWDADLGKLAPERCKLSFMQDPERSGGVVVRCATHCVAHFAVFDATIPAGIAQAACEERERQLGCPLARQINSQKRLAEKAQQEAAGAIRRARELVVDVAGASAAEKQRLKEVSESDEPIEMLEMSTLFPSVPEADDAREAGRRAD